MEKLNKAKGSVKEFFDNFLKVLRRPDMIVLPGNLAFFFVLAIIPVLALMSYGASLINLSTDFLYSFITKSFSQEIADMVLGINLGNSAHFVITLVFGLYIASNGADSMITASNTIYGIPNKSWLKRRFKALWLSLLIVILLIFMLIVPVFGESILNLIKEVNLNTSITNQIIAIYEILKGPITWLVMFAIIRIIYATSTSKKHKNRVINYGALFTTILWIIFTKIYSMYVNSYADYTALYGGLASIVVLMIWIYILSYVFVVGMALNSQKDENNLLKNGTIKNDK